VRPTSNDARVRVSVHVTTDSVAVHVMPEVDRVEPGVSAADRRPSRTTVASHPDRCQAVSGAPSAAVSGPASPAHVRFARPPLMTNVRPYGRPSHGAAFVGGPAGLLVLG